MPLFPSSSLRRRLQPQPQPQLQLTVKSLDKNTRVVRLAAALYDTLKRSPQLTLIHHRLKWNKEWQPLTDPDSTPTLSLASRTLKTIDRHQGPFSTNKRLIQKPLCFSTNALASLQYCAYLAVYNYCLLALFRSVHKFSVGTYLLHRDLTIVIELPLF